MNRFLDFLTVFAVLLIPVACLLIMVFDFAARNPESLVMFAALVTLAASQLIDHDKEL